MSSYENQAFENDPGIISWGLLQDIKEIAEKALAWKQLHEDDRGETWEVQEDRHRQELRSLRHAHHERYVALTKLPAPELVAAIEVLKVELEEAETTRPVFDRARFQEGLDKLDQAIAAERAAREAVPGYWEERKARKAKEKAEYTARRDRRAQRVKPGPAAEPGAEPTVSTGGAPAKAMRTLDELAFTDGLVGDIVKWICDTAPVPSPAMALGTAVTVIGTLIGRQIAARIASHGRLHGGDNEDFHLRCHGNVVICSVAMVPGSSGQCSRLVPKLGL